jgi:hypothetical protein
LEENGSQGNIDGERELKILQVKGLIIHGNSKEKQPILKKWEGKVKMKNRILATLSEVRVFKK